MTPRVGVVGPLSGERSAWGQVFLEALAHGRAGCHDVEWVVRDDGGDEHAGAAVACELVDEGVACVVGHYASPGAIAAARCYSSADVVLVAPASTDPELTSDGRLVLRLCADDHGQTDLIAHWLQYMTTGKGAFVIADDTRYGQQLADRIATQCGALPIVTVDQAPAQVEHGAVDAVVFAGTHVNAAQLLLGLRAAGYSGAVLTTDDCHTDDLAARAGTAVEGCYVTRPDPEFPQTTAEGIRLAARALVRNPRVRGEALLAALAEADPALRFTPHGDRIGASWGLSRFERGRLRKAVLG